MQKKENKSKKISKFANNQFDFILCITIFLLLALGIVMVLSASAPASIAEGKGSYSYVSKQAIFAGIGIVLMFFISNCVVFSEEIERLALESSLKTVHCFVLSFTLCYKYDTLIKSILYTALSPEPVSAILTLFVFEESSMELVYPELRFGCHTAL